MAGTLWSSLIQRWLAAAARQAVSSRLQTAENPTSDGADPSSRASAEVGLVYAMGIEAGGFEDLLAEKQSLRGNGFRALTGMLGDRSVAAVVCGMGQHAARRATTALIQGHRPACVISAGFSGGLNDDVRLGDIVLGRKIVDCAGVTLDLKLRIDESSARQPRLHLGTLVTVDRLVCSPADKRTLGSAHDALAVDMESLAVAQACNVAGIPCLAVRIISDDVRQELPEFLDRIATHDSVSSKAGVIVGALVRRPSNLKTMYRMREESLVLSDRLARFLTGVINQLPRASARVDDDRPGD